MLANWKGHGAEEWGRGGKGRGNMKMILNFLKNFLHIFLIFSATKNFDDDFSLVDQEKKSSNFSLEAASNLRASRVVGKGRGFTAINSSNGTGQIIHDLQQSIESFSIENRNEIDFLAQAELVSIFYFSYYNCKLDSILVLNDCFLICRIFSHNNL